MSNFKAKSKEVYAKGVEQRGEFTPTGVPLRVYKYWAERAKKPPVRENFCHFWRVVAIWAPLMWVRKTSSKIASTLAFQVSVFAILLGGLVTACILSNDVLRTLLGALGIIVGLFLAVVGIFCGSALAMTEDEAHLADMPPREFARWGALVFPTSIPAFLVTKFLRIKWVKEHAVELVLGVVGVGVLALLTTLSITETPWVAYITLIVLAAAYPVYWAGNKVISFVATWLEGKREIAKMREDAFIRGELSYEEYFGHPERKKRERTNVDDVLDAIGNFFRGVGDFVILAAQVVRVNKWKICPTVEVK